MGRWEKDDCFLAKRTERKGTKSPGSGSIPKDRATPPARGPFLASEFAYHPRHQTNSRTREFPHDPHPYVLIPRNAFFCRDPGIDNTPTEMTEGTKYQQNYLSVYSV